MSADKLHLRALPAFQVLERIVKLSAVVPAPWNWSLQTNIQNLLFNGSGQSDLARDPQLVAALQQTRERTTLICRSCHISDSANNTKIQYSCADGILASIELTSNLGKDKLIEMYDAVAKAFEVIPYVDLVGMMRTAGETTAMQMRERSVADLSEQLRRLGELLSSITQREVEAREKISREMQEQARIQQEAASAEYKAKLDELEGKRKSTEADLDSKRQALERDKAAHETRESKYVRRDMEKKLAEVLKESERLELSAGTQKKRNVIHAFVAVMLLASGGLGVEMLRKVLAMSSADLHYLIPLGAATTLTFFSTLVYYLKWNDRWFREHAETELASKRYKADIVRAAWIAELTSEWAEREGKEIPAELLEAYTRNLFRAIGPIKESEHPLDSVTGLMRGLREIEIGKGRLSLKAKDPKEG